jgi:SAM-dependent methyltransferase
MISGVDMSETGIIYAKQKTPQANFFHMNLLHLPQDIPELLDKNVDAAICTEVLEHLDDPVTFLKNTKMLLKPNATLIITVPGGIKSYNDIYLGHRRHYTKKSLTQILQAADFKIEKIWQGGFPFFNLYKILVTLRGKKIIADAKQTEFSWTFSLLLKIFSILFRFNLPHSYFGWQLVAVAKT